MDELPIIDFAHLADPGSEAAIARALDDAFTRIGFCYFANIGVDEDCVRAAFAASRRFHAMPEGEKNAIAMNAYFRGYMAPNTSTLKTSSVAHVTRPNFSESLMLMHEVTPDDDRFARPLQGPNQWPDLPGFQPAIRAYEAAMHGFAVRLLRPLALALGLPADYLAPFFARPTTFLRLLHYPPQPPGSPADAYGSAPHTDYGCVTMLRQDDVGGLSVRRRDGTWLAAKPLPGTWVINVGDMLARWTNGRWQSTPHAVQNLAGTDRYSIPYFFDVDMDQTIDCLPTCRTDGTAPSMEPVRYGDYLLDRIGRNYPLLKREPAG